MKTTLQAKVIYMEIICPSCGKIMYRCLGYRNVRCKNKDCELFEREFNIDQPMVKIVESESK